MDGGGGRRRLATKSAAEDQALDQIAKEAEARLWAKRQARAEAREIRMRELERQQKEQEENADRQFDMLAEPMVRTPRSAGTAGSRYLSSRRSSEDSLEDSGSLRELRHELKEVEEKFRKAMIANAQLDNDKMAQTYQLELLKDRLEELEEEHSQLKREHRDKCREHEQLKRLCSKLKDDLALTSGELEERDRLITEKGLVIIGEEVPPDEDGTIHPPKKALVSVENAQLLESAGDGSLDVRLASFAKEKSELQDQISHLKLELEEEKSKRRKPSSTGLMNGPSSDYDYDDIQREASKQLADYKFRAQKAEQDVATLQATVARLESQVIRYKTAAEVSEQSEEALKAEKGSYKERWILLQMNTVIMPTTFRQPLQVTSSEQIKDWTELNSFRPVFDLSPAMIDETSATLAYSIHLTRDPSGNQELVNISADGSLQSKLTRDALSRAEELETSNTHLLKRLDKLKNAKSALLKEL